jgi:hypothetical protein
MIVLRTRATTLHQRKLKTNNLYTMKKWTKKEDKLLKEAVTSQGNLKDVCRALQLSEYLVKKRMSYLNLEFPKDEIKITQFKQTDRTYRQRYEEAVAKITDLESQLKANSELRKLSIKPYKIKPVKSDGKSEAVAVTLLSDWHYEEVVKPQGVNFLNDFNEDVAKERIRKCFITIVKYLNLHKKETHIEKMILALLGDFISGGIHDELKEGNTLLPIEAIWKVQKHITSGINYILENSCVKLVIPCSPGNHGRTTVKQRIATDHGNSLEWLMYLNLAKYYEGNNRVEFVVNEGYHTYIDIYDYTIRFHHGQALRYQGGVGGIYIPVNKAINQWNKAKKADLDCFGHFHQMKNGGTFISNGSLIGWNSFAIRIKTDFEKPKQTFFLIDKKYFVNCVRPIILNGE